MKIKTPSKIFQSGAVGAIDAAPRRKLMTPVVTAYENSKRYRVMDTGGGSPDLGV